ncbi:M23 family metallopeptidase [Granulicoccus sp. GXG6511]|uniref:M23 family metallopeptidase n=1 Tax=Granulicoccus sp. GXG6511 TaxID=3381351 RepID=UPI003D7E30FE
MSQSPIHKPETPRAQRDGGRSPRRLVAGGLASVIASAALATASVVAPAPALGAEMANATAANQADVYSLPTVNLAPEIEDTLLRHQAAEDLKRQQEEAAHRAAAPVAHEHYTLGSGWGAVGAWSRYHTGVDLQAPVGTPVHAAAHGVVEESKAGGWAGVHAVIKHDDGSSLYAHLDSLTVKPGDTVEAGDLIGYVGMTGRTFGAHLHFEFYPDGAATSDPYTTSDPSRWLESRGVHL